MFIPQGFTPNGDGYNDYFVIKGLSDFPDNELTIFNRWGEIVYQAEDYKNNWDGKATRSTLLSGGSDYLPNDTYYYVFVTKANNKSFSGYIYLTK
jgi:gliding motility-associated-like protein